jgi:hypothetical protein
MRIAGRYRHTLSDDGNTITGHWDLLGDDGVGVPGWTSR